jgi:hypothetical protein
MLPNWFFFQPPNGISASRLPALEMRYTTKTGRLRPPCNDNAQRNGKTFFPRAGPNNGVIPWVVIPDRSVGCAAVKA